MPRFLVLAIALLATALPALDRTSAAQQAGVARSNQHAKILPDVMAALAPEGAGRRLPPMTSSHGGCETHIELA